MVFHLCRYFDLPRYIQSFKQPIKLFYISLDCLDFITGQIVISRRQYINSFWTNPFHFFLKQTNFEEKG